MMKNIAIALAFVSNAAIAADVKPFTQTHVVALDKVFISQPQQVSLVNTTELQKIADTLNGVDLEVIIVSVNDTDKRQAEKAAAQISQYFILRNVPTNKVFFNGTSHAKLPQNAVINVIGTK